MPDLWMDVDAALSEVPVNIFPLVDATDFKTIENAVAYNAAGMALYWHFVTTAGAYSVVAVTPTTGGNYDWTDQGDSGIYTIEIPASGGASANNDTEGFGWFTGSATGVLPWRGPTIGFRAAGLNNLLIDDAYSATRGLSGTALPEAAADAAGGLPISDAGGLDLDAQIKTDIDNIATKAASLTFTVANKLDSNVYTWNGTAVSAPATAGIPDVNMKNIANAAVSTTAAQIGVNVVQISADATAADNAESFFDGTGYAGTNNTMPTTTTVTNAVTISTGTGAGQLDITSGVVKANLAQILGTALTETAGQIAAAFKKFFNVATPTGTVNSLPDAVAGAANGLFIAGTNAATTISNASGSALTLTSSGGDGHGLIAQGNGTGSGITGVGGGTSGNGIYAAGDNNGHGILATGGDSALGLTAGIYLSSQSSGTPVGLYVEDGAIITDDTGTALLVSSTGGNGVGIIAVGNGSGGDLVADITGNVSGSVGSVSGAVTITANQAVNVAQWGGANIVTPAVTGSPVVTLGATQAAYAPAKAGDQMDLVNAPNSTAIAAVVDANWDEVLTGATHNIATSAGRRLRELASSVIYTGTVASSTGNTVVLDSGASSADGAYDPALILITSGTGVGQTRLILQYTGATRTAVIDRDWKVNPALNDEFAIIADAGREHVNEGLAQTGSTASTIKLNALASSEDDAYIGQRVFIRSGTGQDQARRVASYNGTTKVATMTRDWDVTPDATSAYVILPTGAITDTDIANAVPTVVQIRSEMDSNSTKLADILTDTGTTIPAQITALNNLSAAQVNAEVVDALNVDTYAEPSGAPAATASLAAKIGRLYQVLRNKITVTSSAKTLYSDAGASLWSKTLTDDGTTYTEDEGA